MEESLDATEIRLQNYRTALDRAQQYLALAIGSAVGIWLLRGESTATKVTVPGVFVEVDWETARVLLLGFHIVISALATYTVETCIQIAEHLKSQPEIASAMYEYPSIPCSPWPGVRFAVPIISMVLIGWARFAEGKALGLSDVVVLVLLISVHGTLLSYLWKHPSGKISFAMLRR